MKLQFLKLINKYRSLEPFEHTFLKHPLLKNRIDPICLVGLNGSGKSNFLELLSDIFFDIEIYFLHNKKLYKKYSPKYFPYANNKTKEIILFEIEYQILVKGKEEVIRIKRSKETGKKLQFELKDTSDSKEKGNFFLLDEAVARNYLPLVVAYTSGLNDLLSLPYIDVQDYYAQQVAIEALSGETSDKNIPSPNLLLLNYDTNAAIVISNFILGEEGKLEVFKKNIRISRINSFRIIIRLNKLYGNKKVEVTDELQQYINDLQECASLIDLVVDEVRGNVYTFDFIVNDATKGLFAEKFGNAQKLFEALTKLNLLNTLCIRNANRGLLRKRREKGQLIKFPQIASLDKIFDIEKIELVIKKPLVRTEYEKISDGEHQFIHIIGGILLFDESKPERDLLYLLDEPDTHFNPLWRSDFFFQLENVLTNKKVEFVITTHSPFILSDCHGYNVFKFTRVEDKVSFQRVEQETYGSTYENVTEYLFDPNTDQYRNFDSRIAKMAFVDIEILHKEINQIDTKEKWASNYENFLKRIRMLGESVDRLNLLEEYENKKKEYEPNEL